MTMDENQSLALGIKSDSMELESKEIYELHDSSRDISEMNGRKNHKDTVDLSVDNASKTAESPKKEGQNGRSHIPRDQEHECLVSVEELRDHKENKSRESSPPRNDSSCVVKGEMMYAFVDQNVLHTELPDLEVCYKEEIDQHIVKDICVDEGNPEKVGVVNESIENDKPGHFLPQSDKAKESFDKEVFASEEEEISLQKNPNVVSLDHSGSEEQKDSTIGSAKDEVLVKEFLISEEEEISLQKNPDIVSPEQCGSEEQKKSSMGSAKEGFGKEVITSHEEEISLSKNPNVDQRGRDEQQKDSITDSVPSSEANISMTGEAATDPSKDPSLVDKKIPIAEIGTRDFIKSLLETLDGEGSAAKQWSPQIADKNSVPQSLAMALVNEEAQQEAARCSSSSFDNKPVESAIEEERTEDVKEQSVTPWEATHDEQIQPGDKSQSLTNNKAQTITEPNVPKQERWTSDSASIMGRMLKDDGETSFSAASLINYSEPVPFSGSISHRSDSSATSTRSFAFPGLQPDYYYTSPVRMAKADRRLRKQSRWRSGVFCCRF